MYFSHDTLDDLLHEVLETLLKQDQLFKASRGYFKELFGCCLHLRNPRARLSRSEGKGKVFSALGELLWYLSGDTRLKFIDYYLPQRFQKESDDQIRVRSGYGKRLASFRGMNQLQNVIRVLREKPNSRRAVIQLFDATDLKRDYASIPCTCTLQFLARDGRMHMFASMRSNDAYIGLPHDVFAFTRLAFPFRLAKNKMRTATISCGKSHLELGSISDCLNQRSATSNRCFRFSQSGITRPSSRKKLAL